MSDTSPEAVERLASAHENSIRMLCRDHTVRSKEADTLRAQAARIAELEARAEAAEAEVARLRQRLASIESAPRHAKLADHDLVEWMADAALRALQEKPYE